MCQGSNQTNPGLTADALNSHYAAVSADSRYRVPPAKHTASLPCQHVTEMEVFRMLDRLKPTATGLDKLPAWFLRLGAPVFAASLALLFNQSVNCGIVPQQWKEACITPVPKVAHPSVASDYRPISITSVLSRTLERHIVRAYIYPALQQPPAGLHFADQYVFRPTGSTNAALITLLHNVSTMLTTQPLMSTTGFPTSHRRSAYVTPKCSKRWLKQRFFRFLCKSQRLIISSAVNLVRQSVS